MRFLLPFILVAYVFGQTTPAVNTPIATTWPLGSVPMWVKITVTNSTTNLTVVCAGPASFTGICGTTPVAKAAATTQSVTLATPAVNFAVDECIIKTATAFTGTTTLTATVGKTGSLTSCTSVVYDMKAAVSTTNFGQTTAISTSISFNGTDAMILALASTIDNISSISAGSVVVWIKLVFLP
jgi:hypothetical protein